MESIVGMLSTILRLLRQELRCSACARQLCCRLPGPSPWMLPTMGVLQLSGICAIPGFPSPTLFQADAKEGPGGCPEKLCSPMHTQSRGRVGIPCNEQESLAMCSAFCEFYKCKILSTIVSTAIWDIFASVVAQ